MFDDECVVGVSWETRSVTRNRRLFRRRCRSRVLGSWNLVERDRGIRCRGSGRMGSTSSGSSFRIGVSRTLSVHRSNDKNVRRCRRLRIRLRSDSRLNRLVVAV